MSKQRDEKWLDDELQRIAGGTAPEFDARLWKQKYSAEFQSILSRGGSHGTVNKASDSGILRMTFAHPWARLVVAAAILVAVTLLLVRGTGPGPEAPGENVRPVARSSTEIVTMMSLRQAYRRGGAEGLDQQLDEALRVLGPRSAMMSVQAMFDNSEG